MKLSRKMSGAVIALAASGLLTPTIGGPSIYSPAPQFLFSPPASYAPFAWPEATGPDRGSLLADDGFPWQTDATGGTELTLSNGTPSLSADGNTVAVLSTQPLVSQLGADGNIPCKPCLPNLFSTNAYVVDMSPGLSRSQAVKPLSEWASYDFESDFANAGTITGLRISPEGDEVAFATQRTNFPL